MNNDLRERIDELYKKKEKIDAINGKEDKDRTIFEEKMAIKERKYREKMDAERDTFECSLGSLKLENERLSEEFKLLCGDIMPIRMGDLLEELANLSDVDVSDICTEIKPVISFTGDCRDIEEITKLLNTVYYSYIATLEIILTGYHRENAHNLTQSFKYLMRLNSKFTDIQSDGKTLLEHCKAKLLCGFKMYTDLIVCENIEDLVLNIPLGYLVRKSDTEWYPTDLITQAVINCIERNNKEKASQDTGKSRTRKLSDETNQVGVND